MSAPVQLVDLTVEGDELRSTLGAIERVLRRGWFVLGPEVAAFEEELATSSGVAGAVGVGSGTDALILALRALGIGRGDEVIVPQMTAFPTAVAVVEVGATPVLVDIEGRRPLLDVAATERALTEQTRAVILVHLYGAVADASAFRQLLDSRAIPLIEDCAQAQGAMDASGGPVGTTGQIGVLSFYPTKNLGAVGDGGAVISNDRALLAEVRAWRSHGERGQRYLHELPARNSRLDDLHAAVLRERLRALPEVVARRLEISRRYEETLSRKVDYVSHGAGGAPHLAVVLTEHRDRLADALRDQGIGTGVHYPAALSSQPGLARAARSEGGQNAARWASTCLSLPLHPRLTDEDLDRVIDAVGRAADAW